MDLKEFIVNTLRSIEQGLNEVILDVQEEDRVDTTRIRYAVLDPAEKDTQVPTSRSGVIHFDLEVASGTESDKGLGIKVLSVEAGGSKGTSHTEHSRIKFAVRKSTKYVSR